MNAEENLTIMGLKIAVDNLALEIARQRQQEALKSRFDDLPEWLTLEQAVALKGGAALTSYRQKEFLMPCCGKKYKKIGGRRCWRRDDVIEWIGVSDEELKPYADRQCVPLPKIYRERAKK